MTSNVKTPRSDDGDGFNLDICAAYKSTSAPEDTYEVVAGVMTSNVETPRSDDGDGFNLDICAAYKSTSTPHGRN